MGLGCHTQVFWHGGYQGAFYFSGLAFNHWLSKSHQSSREGEVHVDSQLTNQPRRGGRECPFFEELRSITLLAIFHFIEGVTRRSKAKLSENNVGFSSVGLPMPCYKGRLLESGHVHSVRGSAGPRTKR